MALRTERDHKVALLFQKVKVTRIAHKACIPGYSLIMLPSSYKQLELSDEVSSITKEGEKYILRQLFSFSREKKELSLGVVALLCLASMTDSKHGKNITGTEMCATCECIY